MTDNIDKQSKYDATMARLRDAYMQELPERFVTMEELVLVLEQGGDINDAYDKLFRDVHSLKGSGGTYGFPLITAICHQIEDNLRDKNETDSCFTQDVIDRLLKYIDLLRQFPDCFKSGETALARLESEFNTLQELSISGRRCLVVDGSDTTLSMISLVLGDESLEISAVDNGLEALQRLLQEPFDLLITGMAIGNLNGKALIAAMRLSDSGNAKIPAILLTSSDTDTDTDVVSPSADVVIRKGPEMPGALIESIRQLF